MALLVLLAARSAVAQLPPVVAGFPNVAQTPGQLLSGLNAPQQGRTAIVAYHDGVLFTVPEVPSSQPGADFQVRSWDIRDPRHPIELRQWGTTPMPINAHGYFHSGPYLILGSNWPPGGEWSFRLQNGSMQRTAFPDLMCAGVRGCLFGPWFVGDTYWSYGEVSGDAEIYLDWQLRGRWDHLGLTGVVGHPFLLGDLLIFASDQSRTGVATYDVGDPANPVLLDVLTAGGPGGYWPELWGSGDGRLYIVFPYNSDGNGFRVVDATDPTDLRFVTDRPLPGAASMYVQFQDEYAFMGGHKVDMRSFESVLHLDGANVARTEQAGTGVDTSQFLLPLGNLLVTGGIGEDEGMAIWAHQAAPDSRGPSVAYHVPQAGRTNYPRGMPISLLIHETLATSTIVNGQSVIVRPLDGAAIAGRLTFSFDDVLTFQPAQPLQADTTYEVVLPDGGIKDVAGNGMVGYSFTFSTGASVGGNAPPVVTSFSASPYPVAPGAPLTLTADATDPNGGALQYRFDFGDGSAKTAWSTQRSAQVTYASPGHYRATVQVRDPAGAIASQSVSVTAAVAPSGRPTNSSQLACNGATRRLWSVNSDSGTAAAVNADSLARELEVPACAAPRGIAVAAGGTLWIACHDDDRVVVLDPNGALLASLPTGYGSAPVGIAAAPDGTAVYVTLAGAGRLLRFNASTRAQTGSLALGPTPRAIAVTANGGRVLVTRFLSPEHQAQVWDVNAATFTLSRTLVIPKFGGDANRDSTAGGRGVANYLAAIAISPDGRQAWVAATKPNAERGVLTGPGDLDQDNTVRTVVAQIDLTTNLFSRAIDVDNSDSASALAFSPLGDYLLLTLQGNNELVVIDALAAADAVGLGGFVTRLGTGAAPQAVCSDAATNRTFVNDFLSRGLTVLETDVLFRTGAISVASSRVATVASEPLPAPVAAGKRIFYDAGDPRMSAEGYMSCATCHVDGGHDGRTWDFSGRGEGLRNTATLHGRGGMAHGNVHWSANFDEIQDFENDIRNAFGGSGFLTDADFAARSAPLGPPKAGRSPDLDALAAYVASLTSVPRSPARNPDGSMTAEAQTGAALFTNLGCASCHAGARYTDSTTGTATLHDVGTLRTTSGHRLGGTLTGIDTPTLLGVWDTAPYLHDGSAATLDDVFRVTGGVVIPAESGTVSGGASLVTDYVDLNNDDTVRGRAYVAIGAAANRLTLRNVDGGSGGTGAIEVRYSAGYGVFPLTVTVNGTAYTTNLQRLSVDPEWRHVNWGRVRYENVTLAAGATNTVVLSCANASSNISLDEIVVSRPAELAAAQPHRQVLGLATTDRTALLAYLRQLDGAPPSGPSPTATAVPSATRTPTANPATATPTSLPNRYPFGGSVRALSGAALSGVTVTLSGALDDSMSTGGAGAYVFRDLPSGSYRVGARQLGVAAGVLTTADVQAALQASVGLAAPSGWRGTACDVTGDGRITALDAARLLRRVNGEAARFPVAVACDSDWLFAPAAGVAGGVAPVIQAGQCTPGGIAVGNLTSPVTAADLVGAAFGDCSP